VADDFELTRENFTSVHLPNEKNFTADPRPDTPTVAEVPPCMENCKDKVAITMRAAVLDVTPEEGSNPSGSVISEDGSIQAAATPAAAEPTAAEPTPAATAVAALAAAADPAKVAQGEKVFRKCRACHQVGEGAKNRVGPALNGVIGRTAGSAEGYSYSPAMEAKGAASLVWNADTLDGFLAKPKEAVPGTRMTFPGLKSAEDRAAVAAYLSQFKQ
jgi:cytochrome c2